MSKKNRHVPPVPPEAPAIVENPDVPDPVEAAPIGTPEADAAPPPEPALTKVSLRLSAGKHAVRATEAEVHVDGARIAGGEGTFEFDLFAETWVDIHIVRS